MIDDKFFIWTGTKERLISKLDELNRKHETNKFEYKTSKTSIFFLDTDMYIKNKKLDTKIYRKQTNRQSFLHIDWEHPKSFKDSIPYIQAIRIKRICTTSQDLECPKPSSPSKEPKQQFLKQSYNSELLEKHIKTVQKLDRNELIKGNKKGTPMSTHIPLAITYNRFLPNTSKIIREKWKIISVNESLKQFFKTNPLHP